MNFVTLFIELFIQSDYFSKFLVLLLAGMTFLLFVFFIYGYLKLLYKTKSTLLILNKIHKNELISDLDGEIAFILKQNKIYQKNNEELFFLMIENFLISEYRLKIFFGVSASVGPLLGLLGTIWGIMNVFQSLEGNADLTAIAPGISEALITTAAGLFLAIPSLCAYHLFSYLIEKYFNIVSSLYYLFIEKSL